jgi:hypothetical protein
MRYLTEIFWFCRFSANRPRPQTPLDSIKFVCKDLWPLLFRKQIDNLKTNHRGVFVLTDTRFQPLSRVSVDRKAGVKAPEETLSRAQAVSSCWHLRFRASLGTFGLAARMRVQFADRRVSTVPLLPVRDHTRCACGFGYGCHCACGLERDPCCDVSDQDERCESLNVALRTMDSATEGNRWPTKHGTANASSPRR